MIRFEMPIRLKSIANGSQGNWRGKAFEKQRQKEAARIHTASALNGLAQFNALLASTGRSPIGPPTQIIITRIGKRKLDDDNLAYAAKAVRDGIAKAIGIDDGDDRLSWKYEQEIGKEYGVRVEIREAQ